MLPHRTEAQPEDVENFACISIRVSSSGVFYITRGRESFKSTSIKYLSAPIKYLKAEKASFFVEFAFKKVKYVKLKCISQL